MTKGKKTNLNVMFENNRNKGHTLMNIDSLSYNKYYQNNYTNDFRRNTKKQKSIINVSNQI